MATAAGAIALSEAKRLIAVSFLATCREMLPLGVCPPPQLVMFDRTAHQKVLAHVTCRPYRRGADAVEAITHLGRLGGALAATDILFFWEECDLRTSLYGVNEGDPHGIVVLDAEWNRNTLSWYPFEVGGQDTSGGEYEIVEQPRAVQINPHLHPVVNQAIAWWRSGGSSGCSYKEALRMLGQASSAGYDVAVNLAVGKPPY